MINKLRPGKMVWLGVILTLSIASTVSAQSRGPRLATDPEIFNFGVMPEYCEVSHVFWLRNVGDQPAKIDKLIPNCGCTQASISKNEVAPGDSSRVELIFGSHNYHHEVEKFAQVVADAKGRIPALTFQAYVVPDSEYSGPLVASPRALDVDKIAPEETAEGWVSRFTLHNKGKSPITITTLETPDQVVSTSGYNGTLQPGEKVEVTVHFTSGVPVEKFSKSLTFKVSGLSPDRLTVPIFRMTGVGEEQSEG